MGFECSTLVDKVIKVMDGSAFCKYSWLYTVCRGSVHLVIWEYPTLWREWIIIPASSPLSPPIFVVKGLLALFTQQSNWILCKDWKKIAFLLPVIENRKKAQNGSLDVGFLRFWNCLCGPRRNVCVPDWTHVQFWKVSSWTELCSLIDTLWSRTRSCLGAYQPDSPCRTMFELSGSTYYSQLTLLLNRKEPVRTAQWFSRNMHFPLTPSQMFAFHCCGTLSPEGLSRQWCTKQLNAIMVG